MKKCENYLKRLAKSTLKYNKYSTENGGNMAEVTQIETEWLIKESRPSTPLSGQKFVQTCEGNFWGLLLWSQWPT